MRDEDQISVVHIASGDLFAGAEVMLLNLVRHQKHIESVSVSVILLNNGVLENQLLESGIAVEIFSEQQFGFFRLLSKIVRCVAKRSADIVHTHRQKEHILGSIAAMLLPRVASVRTVHGATEHVGGRFSFRHRLIDVANYTTERFLQRQSIYVSDELHQSLLGRLPFEHCRVIPNGIDIENTKIMSGRQVTPTLAESSYNVGFFGRFSDVKRPLLFIESAELFCEQFGSSDCSFHMFGDGPLRSACEERIAESRYMDHFYVHGFRSNPYPYLRQMDCIVLTSEHEGQPMVILESMALKVLVVARKVGGIAEIVTHMTSGLLADSDLPNEIANCLMRAVSDESLRRRIVASAYESLCENHSIKNTAQQYLLCYREVLGLDH